MSPDRPAVPSSCRRSPGRRGPSSVLSRAVSGPTGRSSRTCLPALRRSAEVVAARFGGFDADVVDAGFVSDAAEARERAAERLRAAGCDLIIMFLTTYMTSSMVVPIALRTGADVLLLNLQPSESMDHASFDTGQWLAYCGACPLPEVGNAFERCGIPYRSVSGYLARRAGVAAGRGLGARCGVRRVLRTGRHGLMGHLYPGMYDVSTDLTLVPAHLGGHVEVLEFDDLRVRVADVTDDAVAAKLEPVRAAFELAESVDADDLDGRRASPSDWSRSSPTSRWTRWPITTAVSKASSTSASAPA